MSRKIIELKNSYLVKQLPSGTAFLDKGLQLLHASDKWIADFEFNLNTVFGEHFGNLFPNVEKDFHRNIQDCLVGHTIENLRQSHTTSEGIEKWFEWHMTPWFNEEEDIIGVIVNTTDVSYTLRKEKDLLLIENLLREKSDISKIGSWTLDVATDDLHWCKITKEIHGVLPNYVPDLEKSIQFYKQGHSRNTVSLALHQAFNKGTEWNEKVQVVTAQGQERWVSVTGKPLYQDDKLVSLFGTFEDIHANEFTGKEALRNEGLLQTILDNLPLNVYIKDLDSKKILVNKYECKYMGVNNPEELLGKDDFEIFPKKYAQLFRNEDLLVMESQIPIIGREKVIVRENGSKNTFISSKIPLKDANGVVTGLVGMSMDISELKQKEEDLNNLIEVTAEQNKKLINFAHIISHDLRSHSANFSMLLGFLEDEKSSEGRKNIIEMLVSASDRLLETLENLNDVVTINNNVNLDQKKVVLRNEITKVRKNLAALLDKNNAKLINRVSDLIVVSVVPAYLNSILMNFITNAIKYREPDRDPVIELSVRKNQKITVLSIKDNGTGIDLEKNGEKLFGMYKTFHNNVDARGIGLYISKNQIEAMKGKITVTSEVGKGTTFNIFFYEKN